MVRATWLFVALLAAVPVSAAEDSDAHSGHQPPSAAAEDGASQREQDASAGRLGKNMQAMRKTMAQVRETADLAERQRLLGEHMQAMQEQIRIILAMQVESGGHEHASAGGQEAGDGDKQRKNEAGARGGMTGERGMMGGGMMKKMHQKMEQRVDALEQLLEQLIEHEAAEEARPGD